MLENDTLWGGTYLYGLYMGVSPREAMSNSVSLAIWQNFFFFLPKYPHTNNLLWNKIRSLIYKNIDWGQQQECAPTVAKPMMPLSRAHHFEPRVAHFSVFPAATSGWQTRRLSALFLIVVGLDSRGWVRLVVRKSLFVKKHRRMVHAKRFAHGYVWSVVSWHWTESWGHLGMNSQNT